MNTQQFAQKIREKYPGNYDDISDVELTDKIITKYPQYKSQVTDYKGTLSFSPKDKSTLKLTSLKDQVNAEAQPSALDGVTSKIKSTAGGFAEGVGGAALTAEDYLGKKVIDTVMGEDGKVKIPFTDNTYLYKKENAPSLHEQFQDQFGKSENPNLYGAGQLGGEVASLAAPVSTVGKLTEASAKAIGAGNKISKLAKAGAEGAAFTAGQGLQEGKDQSLADYAVNAGLNMVIPGVGMASKSIGEKLPARIINSLIKPGTKDFAFGKNPGETVAKLVPSANTMEDLIQGIRTAKEDAGSKIGSAISQSKSQLSFDPQETFKFIDEALVNANKTPRTNQMLINRLENVKADLTEAVNNGGNTMQSAQEIKGLIGDLTKWTGSHSDDTAVNKALQKTYTGVRDKMDETLKKELTPEQFKQYKQAADDYGNLLSAENAAVHRDAIQNRQDLISFGNRGASILGALGTAVATGGAAIPTLLAGLGGVVIDKSMATPAFKTRLAKLLSKLPTGEAQTVFEKIGAKEIFTPEDIKKYFGGATNKK